jgi:hypothetical protein
VHLVGRVHAKAKLSAVGALPGVAPAAADRFVWFLEYHYNTTIPLNLDNDPRYVHTPSPTIGCSPNSGPNTCLVETGSAEITAPPSPTNFSELRYDGPDVGGGVYRFRIANEGPFIITDYATLDVVPSSTWEPVYDGG